MDIIQIGHLGYKLYCLGWQNAVHQTLAPTQHVLLSALLYYRRGFAAGSAWAKEHYLKEMLQP